MGPWTSLLPDDCLRYGPAPRHPAADRWCGRWIDGWMESIFDTKKLFK